MIIRKQFLKTAGISLIILSVMFGCGCFKRNLSTVSNDAGPVKINDDTGSKGNKGQVLAQAVVYKTSKDYSAFVPVILSADKKEIVSYPAPTDVYYRGKLAYPVALKNGYCLDIRGINEYAAFTDFTYQEYAALKTAPTKEELMKRIIDKHPFQEIIYCGPRANYRNETEELNRLIDEDFNGMKVVKFPKMEVVL